MRAHSTGSDVVHGCSSEFRGADDAQKGSPRDPRAQRASRAEGRVEVRSAKLLPLQAALRCPGYCRSTLSGLRQAQNGTSLAMYPSVTFGFHTQRYVKKGRRLLSDAPSCQFSEPLARRLPMICGGKFLSVCFRNFFRKRPFRSISRAADFGRLVDVPFRG